MTYQLLYITCGGQKQAADIAKALVGERLVACCNIIPKITSIFLWEGSAQEEEEVLLLAKSRTELFPEIKALVGKLHSYDCPCITALSIDNGSEDFLNWISDTVRKPAP